MCDDKYQTCFNNKIRTLIQEKNTLLIITFVKQKVKTRHWKTNLNIFMSSKELQLSHPKKIRQFCSTWSIMFQENLIQGKTDIQRRSNEDFKY